MRESGAIITGTTPSTKQKDYYGSRHMFIGPGDIGDGAYVKSSSKYLSQLGLQHAKPLPENSVMVVCIGATIGKVAMTIENDCATNQQINSVIANSCWYPRFLFDALSYRSWELPKYAGRAAVPIVNKTNFGKFKIPFATFVEQKAIGNSLSAVDTKIATEEDRLTALQALFKSMLHQLMTGQIRLLSDEGLCGTNEKSYA